MRAIVAAGAGDAGVLHLADVPDPEPRAGEVLIRVTAAGVNRADVLQRMGFYPPPAGASELLGLEVSGEVVSAADGVERWCAGDRVVALLEGGGYAELVAVRAGQVMPAPDALDPVAAAGIPEVFITAHDNLFTRARLQPGETLLVHGGAGGVGSAAVQLAAQAGCDVLVTVSSDAKRARSLELGARWVVDYTQEDFVARAKDATGGRGVDVILDVMGAAYLERNLEALAVDGRIVVIGMQGGTSAELDLARMSRKRATVMCTALRSRPAEQKQAIVSAFEREVLPRFSAGGLDVVVDRILPLERAADAHRALERGEVIGKVLLQVLGS